MKNYVMACKPLGVKPSRAVTDQLTAKSENKTVVPLVELAVLDSNLGPNGARALCAALCGCGVASVSGAYADLRTLVLRNCACGPMGAWSISELLRVCGVPGEHSAGTQAEPDDLRARRWLRPRLAWATRCPLSGFTLAG